MEVSLPKHAFDQAGDGIDHDGCGKLAATEDVVADGDFFVGQVEGDALIHTFVAAADEEKFVAGGEFAGEALIVFAALGGEEDYFLARRLPAH